MNLPRLNLASSGWVVAQEFDTNDLFANAYDDTNRPIQYAARYTWVVPADGIPVFRQVANTQGPIGQWIVWPKGARVFGQWGQVFPAKMAGEGPDAGKAFPLSDAATVDPQLGGLAVASLDGRVLAADTYGLVVAGTDLGAQQALFFTGGSGGPSFLRGDLLYCHNTGETLGNIAARHIGNTGRILMSDGAHPLWVSPGLTPRAGYFIPFFPYIEVAPLYGPAGPKPAPPFSPVNEWAVIASTSNGEFDDLHLRQNAFIGDYGGVVNSGTAPPPSIYPLLLELDHGGTPVRTYYDALVAWIRSW